MIICEICGAANVEYDEQCRICGHQFTKTEPQPSTVVTSAAVDQAYGTVTHPDPWGQGPQQERMASISHPPATSASPLLGNPAHHPDPSLEVAPEPGLPPFMQTPARPLSSPEPVQLISASDLPDWIRQIAEDDRAKAEAEAIRAAEQVEPATPQVAPSFQTDSRAAGPSTHWLSKTATVPHDAVDPWAVTDTSIPTGQADVLAQPQVPAYPTVTPTPIYLPEPLEKPSRKPRLVRAPKADRAASTEPRRPIYRSAPVQVACLLLLLVVLAALLV